MLPIGSSAHGRCSTPHKGHFNFPAFRSGLVNTQCLGHLRPVSGSNQAQHLIPFSTVVLQSQCMGGRLELPTTASLDLHGQDIRNFRNHCTSNVRLLDGLVYLLSEGRYVSISPMEIVPEGDLHFHRDSFNLRQPLDMNPAVCMGSRDDGRTSCSTFTNSIILSGPQPDATAFGPVTSSRLLGS